MKTKTRIVAFFILLVLLTSQIGFSSMQVEEKPNLNERAPNRAINELFSIIYSNYTLEEGRALVLDSHNSIYIAGKFHNVSSNSFDIILIKYDKNGNFLWNRTWGGTKNDTSYDLARDTADNLYIVGQTESYGNGSADACLIKYDKNGNFLWNKTWGLMEWDAGYGIVMTPSNEIYITGYSESLEPYGDIFLIKYDTSGARLWNETWKGTYTESGNSLSCDLYGNVYITGYTSSHGAVGNNIVIIKYNSSGDQQWNATWGGDQLDEGMHIITDSANNSFIVGTTSSFGAVKKDIVLLKYDGKGQKQWNHTWGGNEDDFGQGIALDSRNNTLIIGQTKSLGDLQGDVLLLKFNKTGNYMWNRTTGGNKEDYGLDITINGTDFIFTTGYTKSEGDDTGDIFLNKYSPLPDSFLLSSSSSSPDVDGTFLLQWTISRDANNYTLYRHTSFITDINGTISAVIRNTTLKSYQYNSLREGVYYFIVDAHNDYGNYSSNCFKMIIHHLPGTFQLTHTAISPDTDGTFNLTWTASSGADSYSVYESNRFIFEINKTVTLLAKDITITRHPFSNINSGNRYYVIVAFNEMGNTTSNCVQILVGRTPQKFILSIEADDPDTDGKFKLIWTVSNFSESYSIYLYSGLITTINSSVSLNQTLIPLSTPSEGYFTIIKSNWSSGIYYFVILSKNGYGNYQSNCVRLNISIPESEHNDNTDLPMITDFLPLIISIVIISVVSILVFLAFRNRKKLLNIFQKKIISRFKKAPLKHDPKL